MIRLICFYITQIFTKCALGSGLRKYFAGTLSIRSVCILILWLLLVLGCHASTYCAILCLVTRNLFLISRSAVRFFFVTSCIFLSSADKFRILLSIRSDWNCIAWNRNIVANKLARSLVRNLWSNRREFSLKIVLEGVSYARQWFQSLTAFSEVARDIGVFNW